MISTTATKTPSPVGAFAVRGTAGAQLATGLPWGSAVRPRPVVDVPPTGAAAPHTSDTPGDLPPRDPLS